MANVILLLGSNLGDRVGILAKTVSLLREKVGRTLQLSSVYETAAWGKTDQAAFLNQVIELETDLSPEEVLAQTQSIEHELGRVRTIHWGPREIDIDLLFYGSQILKTENLVLPHPQLHLRRFTLLPLTEILPDLEHPLLHKTVSELLEECPDKLEAQLYKGTQD